MPQSLSLSPRQLAAIKAAVFMLCLVPLLQLVWGLWNDTLGANPIEYLIRDLGRWALKFLLITLAVTPLRKLTGQHWLMRLRRMLGLFSFFYALLHLSSYLWLDQSLDWIAIAKDIIKRPFITVGMLTFALLLPLAITSTNSMVRRLGGKNWQTLHRLVYVVGVCAVLHFWWLVKLDTTWPMIYAAILAVLLGIRLVWKLRGNPKKRRRIIPIVAKS